jgi:hypothetical protein
VLLGIKKDKQVRCWWLTPAIPATQEAEIWRVEVQRKPGQIACKTLSGKKFIMKKDWQEWLKQ